ncbi:hypothetical protein FKP32DRAFT_1603559 [Trametes sanguinea]|nr:hypothetical protein FKP32DRAFT_1603559 [Trametes sanguinea]
MSSTAIPAGRGESSRPPDRDFSDFDEAEPKPSMNDPQTGATRVQVQTVVAMPDPKDRKAPRFKGKDVQDFIQSLEHLGRACGLAMWELPRYVLRYCSQDVRDVLANESVFTGTDWTAAKARLVYLYESQTRKYKATVKKLRHFAEKQRNRSMVRSRKSLDRYRNKFVKRLGALIEQNQIAENEVRLMFFRGLPRRTREGIMPVLREQLKTTGRVMTQTEPPTVEETLAAARDYYSGNDINRFDDDSSSGSDSEDSEGESDLDSDADDTDCFGDGKSKKTKDGKGKTTVVEEKLTSIQEIEDRLSKRFDDMMVRILGERAAPVPTVIHQTPQPLPTTPLTSLAASSSMSAVGLTERRRCFMCGKTEGVNLDHVIGMRNCPETEGLIRDKILMFSPTEGRIVRCDGQQLPRMQGLPGGLAAYLRNEIHQQARTTWPSTSRDPPPHLANAACMTLGLYRDDEPVVQYAKQSHEHTAFSSTHAHAQSFPAVTRSKGKSAEKTATIEEVPDEPATTTTPSKSANQPVKIVVTPPTPHPSNTEDGWRTKKKDYQRARVEEVADETTSDPRVKTGVKSTSMRFTSDLQESVSFDTLQEQILSTKVTLTLREVLAMSPQLQKRLQGLVRTRREFDHKSSRTADSAAILPLDAPGAASVTFSSGEDLEGLIIRYADAVVLGSSRLFAMASGLVEVVFGNQRATFLVDSGSELNLVSKSLWEKTQTSIDKDGARWSLKGLGGENVPLIGCCRDAPLQLGGRNFDHHFFVSLSEKGHYDGILGQPWLEWYSANIQYNRGGPVVLQAYPSGDKSGASANVKICESENPRNANRLVLTTHAVYDSVFL